MQKISVSGNIVVECTYIHTYNNKRPASFQFAAVPNFHSTIPPKFFCAQKLKVCHQNYGVALLLAVAFLEARKFSEFHSDSIAYAFMLSFTKS
jgi:hypothetical protein